MNYQRHAQFQPAMCTAQEFHRRRAETEMEKALAAGQMSVAMLHLELAKIHRQRREQLIAEDRARPRDGGRLFGGEIACRWVEQTLERLAPGGEALIYTGVAFLDGQSPALQRIASLCDASDAELEVDEIDPDLFGEELTKTAYRQVERIAVVGLSVNVFGGS